MLAAVPHALIKGLYSSLFTYMICQKNLSLNTKPFANDTSIFSTAKNIYVSTDQVNNDSEKTLNWAHQWKMSFNPDLKKQAQKIIFSRKRVKDAHPSVLCNNAGVE